MRMYKPKNIEKNFPALCFHNFYMAKKMLIPIFPLLLETFNLNNFAHKLITLFEYYSSTSKNERSVN